MAHTLPRVHINGNSYFIDYANRELRNVEDPRDIKRFFREKSLHTYLYWTKQLQTILGQNVAEAEMEIDDVRGDWTPVIRFSNGLDLHLLSDEEGNHAGRFEILPE